ncbi:MAG TPA: (2Fe-2S) ferredoxin domain-containing protein [Polyangiaceae bacterium]|nr:(2Fe-2S) ferredoxin domain-containing protein [Polyangiaceae bacterium]
MPFRKRFLFVCTNRRPDDHPKGSCAAKGSERVHAALKKALGARGLALTEARACTASCLDVCSRGVTVLVEPDHVFLGGVTEADVPAIVEGLERGELPASLVLPREAVERG